MSAALRALETRARFGMKPGLDTIRGMLAALSDFHRELRVVHVAGTNGKGSVCAMLAAALHEAGHRTGLYTSPHLVRFHERIRVDGVAITDEELDRALARVQPALDAFPEATYFEVATVLALRHFVDARVDVVVLEVGLGGRLDATNVFPHPLATVITNIALDHTDVLGATVEEIAREKGGILKAGAPAVTGATGAALRELRALAKERGAPLRALGEEFVAIADPDGSFEVDGLREHGAVRVGLAGEHQVENAAIALATLDALDAAGLAVGSDAARRGLARASWPGRLQWVDVAGGPRLLLDGAHNPAGMEALAAHLQREGIKPVVVFGALKDKDWARMVEILAPCVREGIVTRVPLAVSDARRAASDAPPARALDPNEPARMFSQMGSFGMVVEDVGHALRTAEGIAGPEGVVLVTGSLYLVGDVLSRLGLEP